MYFLILTTKNNFNDQLTLIEILICLKKYIFKKIYILQVVPCYFDIKYFMPSSIIATKY